MILSSILSSLLATIGLIAGWVKCVREHDESPRNIKELISLIRPVGWFILLCIVALTVATIWCSNRESSKLTQEIRMLRKENRKADTALNESTTNIALAIDLMRKSEDLDRDIKKYLGDVTKRIENVRSTYESRSHPSQALGLGAELMAVDSALQQFNHALSRDHDLKPIGRLEPVGQIAFARLNHEYVLWQSQPNRYHANSVLKEIPKFCDKLTKSTSRLSDHFLTQLKLKSDSLAR